MKRLAGLICALLLVLGASDAWAAKDTLIVANPADAKTLDPHATMDSVSNIAMRQIYESLVMLNGKGDFVPMMAEKWEKLPDNKGYKFFLRKGVQFHNGAEMTADDVVFSFQRATGPHSALKSLAGYIDPKGIEKVDDYTVILRTSQPVGSAFLASMNHPWASILNRKAVEAAGEDYGMNPVGTGKYKLVSWTKGDKMAFERFDGYYGENAKIKNLVLRTVVEGASRTIELESGAVHVVQDLPSVDIKRVENNKKLRVEMLPGQRLFYLGFDVTKPPYSDVRVRQAMNIAVNRSGILKAIYRGYGEVATGPISSAVLYNKTKETPAPPIDIAKAKKLLADAGFPNGFSGEIICGDRSDIRGIGAILQENLKQIGIDMKIKVFEWGTFIDAAREPKHEPFVLNWWGGAPALDPTFFLVTAFHSASPSNTNMYYYKNKELDALLDEGAAMNNGPERQAIYSKAQDILNTDLPWISLVTPPLVRARVQELEGVYYPPSFVIYYGDAYFNE